MFMRGSLRWRFARIVLNFLFRTLTGAKFLNRESLNLPNTPVIITSNHSSYMDPPLILAFWDRELYFLGHGNLFKNPIFGSFLRFFNGLPLPQGFKRAYDLIEEGYDIGIFPEGGRNKLPQVKIGAFKLSKDKNVPIIVLCIRGNRGRVWRKVLRWLFKRDLRLIYLKTLYPSDFKSEEEMAREFLEILKSALE